MFLIKYDTKIRNVTRGAMDITPWRMVRGQFSHVPIACSQHPEARVLEHIHKHLVVGSIGSFRIVSLVTYLIDRDPSARDVLRLVASGQWTMHDVMAWCHPGLVADAWRVSRSTATRCSPRVKGLMTLAMRRVHNLVPSQKFHIQTSTVPRPVLVLMFIVQAFESCS